MQRKHFVAVLSAYFLCFSIPAMIRGLFYVLLLICLPQLRTFSDHVPISFQHLFSTGGLSNNTVRAIAQDKNGFVWIATDEGLDRYDGIQYTVYKNSPSDPESISSNLILDLMFDHKGYCWVATDNGLNRLNPLTNHFTRFLFDDAGSGKPGVNFILALCEDAKGRIWIGTVNGLHVYSYETETFVNFFHNPDDPTTLSFNHINDIFEDHEGTIWIATHSKGFNRLNDDGKTFTRIVPEKSDPTPAIPWTPTCIFEDSKNRYWIGTWDKGLLRFHPERLPARSAFEPVKEIQNCNVRLIQEDHSGNLWIGTVGEGLYKYDAVTADFSVYRHDPSVESSLSSNRIQSFLLDRNNLFWIGVFNGGVNTFRDPKTQVQHYQPGLIAKTSLSDKSVMSIMEDSSGIVWIGTREKGLDRFDPKTGEYKNYIFATESNKPHIDTVVVNYVYSLHQLDDGRLLVGTMGYGPLIFNPTTETFTNFYNKDNVTQTGYFLAAKDIVQDHQGQYWICSDDGLVICLDSKIQLSRVYGKTGDKFHFNRLTVLAFNDDRHLWVGAEAEGLHLLDIDTGKITYFSHNPANPASLSNNTIWDIIKDRQGRIWIGTNDGLNRYVPETGGFEIVNNLQAFPSRAITGIVEDEFGALWLSTNRGLIRYNPQRNTASWYGLHNGIQGYEFVPKSRYAGKSGRLYFGGHNGFNIIDTKTFKDYPSNAPVVLSDIQVNGAPYISDRQVWDIHSIELPFKQNNLDFLFSLLDYAAPSLNKLEYRIGESQDWKTMNQSQRILFADLSPGVRKLHIRGTNADGSISPKIKEFTISILPPFWMTWWFRGLLAAVFLGIVFAIYAARVWRIKKENKWLEKEVAHRTAALELERDYFHSTIQSSPLMIFGFTPEGILTFLNPTAEIILQSESNKLVGKPWWTITCNSADLQVLKDIHETLREQNIYELELELSFRQGNIRTLVWNFIQRKSERGLLTDVLGFGDDISVRKRMEDQLLRLSNEDGLTQIANRRCFDQQLQKEWFRALRDQLPLSICLIDIDYFKRYNDTYGHLEGDSCLRQVAANLQDQLRRPGDMAARFGGEEFIVLLPNTNSQGAHQVAERIRLQIENLNIPHRDSLISDRVTISIGVATMIPAKDDASESLLTMADKALYQAKEKGRNQVVDFIRTA